MAGKNRYHWSYVRVTAGQRGDFFRHGFAADRAAACLSLAPCNRGSVTVTAGKPAGAAVAGGQAEASGCPVGGKSVAEKIAALTGGNADIKPVVAVLACHGTLCKALLKGKYIGVKSCQAAKISTGSIKRCTWGCQGFGDCVKVCKFDAISMGEDGIPHIIAERCTGCKMCMVECPQHIIWALPRDLKGARPLCSNLNVNKAMVAKNCKAGCIKCELCVKNCPEQCIRMANGIPVVDYSKCTSCGNCVTKCPIKVMALIQPA
jgi:Na+-translocating ferredoxin:NAD+ oxidoreductase RNF subunit RnfB